jgi:glutamate-1-semialdehyde 2,1-aminomutase
MQAIAPVGPVYQAGTLSGNPVAMAAGLKTLELISKPGFFTELSAKTQYLVNGIKDSAAQANIGISTHAVGGMFGLFFTNETNVTRFEQVMACQQESFKQFFHAMLQAGVYLAPSAYEAGFLSAAHSQEILDTTISAAEKAFRAIK